jgi:predicted aldo/keto reductase-like oxidoreductase
MKYRKLGNTGLIVSNVALGTMQFGGKMNMGNLGQEDTTRMVKLALDRGINFIDTADVYSLGESETLVGNALKGVRDGVPYPKWMVLQLDTAEDPRSKILHPERYADGGPWKDLRRTGWSG